MAAGAPQHQVTTPERVAFSVPIAGLGYRTLAYAVDAGLIVAFWVIAYFIYALTQADLYRVLTELSTGAQIAAALGIFFFQWVYWSLSEVLMQGQTLGKRLLKIRVVREDGQPLSATTSAVRNLLRVIDFLPLGYGAAIVAMLIDPKHRRIGDWVAGTVLVLEEAVELKGYPASTLSGGRQRLSSEHQEWVRHLLERYELLEPAARRRLVASLGERVGVAPPPAADDAALRAWLEGLAAHG